MNQLNSEMDNYGILIRTKTYMLDHKMNSIRQQCDNNESSSPVKIEMIIMIIMIINRNSLKFRNG